jgi:hypothetical protein
MAGSVWRVRDELWDVFRELLPEREPQKIGHPRVARFLRSNGGA